MFWDLMYSVLMLLTGVGVFLVGIVMFSDSLEKNSAKSLRSLFKKISNNRIAGVGIGASVTAIIQSSSATTVMTIGLVNAGILTLFQATSIIMGANIGTTVTGLLVSMSTFKIKYIFMSMAFVGALIKIITKKDILVRVADLLISFGILFVGLELMSGALSSNVELKNAFEVLFKSVEMMPLVLILLGLVFTALVQSSSAATAIFLSMIANGLLGFNSAAYLVMGANLGTCITAMIASIAANTNAKRAALIHILFNASGVIFFTAILWPLNDVIIPFYTSLIPDPVWQLSLFHVVFNTAMTLILLWFITPLNRLACFLIKEKADDKDILRFTYIDERILSTPSIALEQTIKEINSMANIARENLNLAFNSLLEQDVSAMDVIEREEKRIDFLNQSLARFFVKLSSSPITYGDEKLLGGFHHVITDIERIGDHAVSIIGDAKVMKTNGLEFTPSAIEELKIMFGKISELYSLSMEIFNERKTGKLRTASKLVQEIDEMKVAIADAHVKRLNLQECTIEGGEYLYATIISLERIASHLTNIAFSIRSYTGSQTEAYKKLSEEEHGGIPKKQFAEKAKKRN